MDLLAQDEPDQQYNLEMQVRNYNDWNKRGAYYLAKILASQLQAGESQGTYRIQEEVTDTQLMELAQMLAKRRLRKGRILSEPHTVATTLQTLLQDKPHEIFGLILLDNRHRLLHSLNPVNRIEPLPLGYKQP